MAATLCGASAVAFPPPSVLLKLIGPALAFCRRVANPRGTELANEKASLEVLGAVDDLVTRFNVKEAAGLLTREQAEAFRQEAVRRGGVIMPGGWLSVADTDSADASPDLLGPSDRPTPLQLPPGPG